MELNTAVVPDLSGRLFAIGDVHGCPKELELLLVYLHTSLGLNESDFVVFQGDYIDRGPDSRAVVELLISFQSEFPNVVFLKGNHEDMLLNYLGYPGHLGESYLGNGGREFLLSYRMALLTPPSEIVTLLPSAHLAFFENLSSFAVHDRFLFVHAGVNPYLSLEEQSEEDLLWIREEFIDFTHQIPKTIIFGHTPFRRVFFDLPYKIGIDTGLVFGNALTCIELKEGVLFQVGRKENHVRSSNILSLA